MDPYQVTIYQRTQPKNFAVALLGDGPPTPSASAGDWAIVPLPYRSAVTVWTGRSNAILLMDVPIVLGGVTATTKAVGHSWRFPPVLHDDPSKAVIDGVHALTSMWRPTDPTDPPPSVMLKAGGTTIPFRGTVWVINNLTWGDAVADDRGNRMLQKMTVQLLEYRADERLQAVAAKKPKAKYSLYTVKKGDTLTSIAKHLKVKGGWRAIGNAQHPPIKDPRHIHVGQKLHIPRQSTSTTGGAGLPG